MVQEENKQIPEINIMSEKNSKTVVITGATGGIGTQICQWLLKKGYTVLAACRSKEKWNKFLAKLDNACVSAKNLKMVEVNLEDFDSIDSFVEQCKELSGNKIDILINNAGMIAPAFKVTKDGYESSIQVNYMAPVRITTGLTPCFSADSLVINTLSCTVSIGKGKYPVKAEGDEYNRQKKEFNNLINYSNTKLLLAKYTTKLHRESNFNVCGVDPGIVDTGIISLHRWYDPIADILFRPFIRSAQKGAVPAIKALEYNFTKEAKSSRPLVFKYRRVKELNVE